MSYDYHIVNRQLTKTEIKEKTDLEIRTQEKNGDWIVDKYGNGIAIVEGYYKTEDDGNRVEIKDDIVRQLCRYGANNPTYIMDTLLKTFPFVFYGDDGWDTLVRMKDFDNSVFKKCIVKDMEYCGYKVIDVETAEADDVIAVLAMKYSATEKVMILSSDKDFAQLQKFPNVEQYSPILKKNIKEPLPAAQLKQLIIRGDKSDGIPNILSKDDTFVEGVRQKPITEAKIINWMNQSPEEFCTDEMLRNFKRNEMLIDLTKIPETLKTSILDTYETAKGKTRQEFMNYMIANRLKNLIEVIDEF